MLNDRMLRVAQLWERGGTVQEIAAAMHVREERVRRDLAGLDLEVQGAAEANSIERGCGGGLGMAGLPVGGGPVEVQDAVAAADSAGAAVRAM